MPRLAIILVAVLIGAAAPARAWCEASCLGPASTSEHCPTHEPPSSETSIAATALDDCPVIESARPIQARFDIQVFAPGSFAQLAPSAPQHPSTLAPQHLPAAVVKRLTPLRI